MATKQLYATGSFKYQHRMLKAGDPVEMDAPTARLYEHLGKVSEDNPTKAPAAETTGVFDQVADGPKATIDFSAKPKAPAKPRKRTSKKK